MPSFNQVTLIGHAGGDAKEKQGNGFSSVSFSLATNENKQDQYGQWSQESIWHYVGTSDTSKYPGKQMLEQVKKGSLVLVQGQLKYSTTKLPDGKEVKNARILVRNFTILSKKEDATQQTSTMQPSPPVGAYEQQPAQPMSTQQPPPQYNNQPAQQAAASMPSQPAQYPPNFDDDVPF